jgi:hypothetical protein
MYRALGIADVARVCAATGAVALAKRLLSGLEVVVAPRHVYGLGTARAVLAEAEDRFDEALAGYSEAAERWREFGNVVELAHALLGLARVPHNATWATKALETHGETIRAWRG